MREKLTLELRCGPINKRARMDLDGDGYCWMGGSVKRPTKGPTLAYILACGKAALKSNGFQGSKKCSFFGFYKAMALRVFLWANPRQNWASNPIAPVNRAWENVYLSAF